MKRVLVFGYFGAGNLGDETNLEQLVAFIQGSASQLVGYHHIKGTEGNRR